MVSVGRERQSEIYRGGAQGLRPAVPSSWHALEEAARRAMSPEAWAYIAGSSGSESTARRNREALDAVRLVPRVLRDVEDRDLSVELFGRRYPTPVIAAPVGVLVLAHPGGDLAAAEGAAAVGVPFVLSSQASVPMERVAAAHPDAPRWFQLYWSSSDELVASFLARAEAIDVDAIVVTLDTHVLGWRPRDLDLAFLPFIRAQGIAQYTSDPVFMRLVAERIETPPAERTRPRLSPATIRTLIAMSKNHPGGLWRNLRSPVPRASVETFLDVFSRSSLTWEHLAFLREHTTRPIVLKGIQHPDDARKAIDHGVDGIIVSNHAGRQVDGAIGSAEALPGVIGAVDGRIPVLYDSGVRSGADVATVLALGAAAALVGRPYAYGLAIAGAAGVEAVLRNIVAEFDLVLALTGHRRPGELGRDCLAGRVAP